MTTLATLVAAHCDVADAVSVATTCWTVRRALDDAFWRDYGRRRGFEYELAADVRYWCANEQFEMYEDWSTLSMLSYDIPRLASSEHFVEFCHDSAMNRMGATLKIDKTNVCVYEHEVHAHEAVRAQTLKHLRRFYRRPTNAGKNTKTSR